MYCMIRLSDIFKNGIVFSLAGINNAWIICASIFMVVLLLYCCLKLLKREKMLSEEYKQLVERQKEYYDRVLESGKESEMEMRRFRHDIKNHLFVLKKLFENNDSFGGLRYLENILEESNKTGIKVETGNHILNIVVEDIMKEEDGITLHWNGVFPQKTKIRDCDLCVLFSNILKNAKEEIKDFWDKNIEVEIKEWKNSLCIECRNAVNENRVRGNQEGRGIGLVDMKTIVKKYNGIVTSMSDKNYIIKILFYDIVEE